MTWIAERRHGAVGAGRLLRLAPGVYSGEANSSPEDIVRRHLWKIVSDPAPRGGRDVGRPTVLRARRVRAEPDAGSGTPARAGTGPGAGAAALDAIVGAALDEAAAIVFDHEMPQQRPQDVHDVLGTYRITSDEDEIRERPSHRPGPARLTSPFARAVYLMFLVSEVHPFADGNGRVARLMMNSELVAGGEVRILIPTVYRLNYLAALTAATHSGNDAALLATLAFARRRTARVDFSDRRSAEGPQGTVECSDLYQMLAQMSPASARAANAGSIDVTSERLSS